MTARPVHRLALVACLGAAALLGQAPPLHAAETDHSPALLSLVRLIDLVPTAQHLRDAQPTSTEAALFAIAADAELGLYARRRAASLLSAFPTREGAARLRALVDSDQAQLAWMATYTYVRAFGPRAQAEVLPFAAQRLDDAAPLLREAIVRGLAYVPGRAAEELVDRQSARETHPVVRAAITRFRRVRSR